MRSRRINDVLYSQNLIPGVKVFVSHQDCDAGRIELSSGTLPVPASYEYETDAIVPLGPWRRPTAQEAAILTSGALPPDSGFAISLVSFPSSLMRSFEVLRTATVLEVEKREINALLRAHPFDRATRSVIRYVNARFCEGHDLKSADGLAGGVYVRRPARSATTSDFRSGKYVGLHVDNWTSYPIEKRGAAPNRIAINLGDEDRFFLYLNIPLTTIYEVIRPIINGVYHTSAIGRVFMTLFPTYPVVRIRIRPGEAYVAPTENIVHDSSTIGMTTSDIIFSLRGQFTLWPQTDKR